MAKVNQAFIRFAPSPSSDVVGYKLYVAPSPASVEYTSPSFNMGNPAPDGTSGLIVVDLSSLPGMTTYDGMYNIGVSSVDDDGNESSMSVKNGVQLDFVAPDPPGAVEVVKL
jgi:hypothetical protein